MIKAAIIGFGTIGPVHYPAIVSSPLAHLCAICDTDPKVQYKIPKGISYYRNYEEMYEKEKPDLVHICLPHYLHYPVSKYFIERGVHVFCEKPVALNIAQAKEFVALEATHPEVKSGICLQNRLNETTEKLKEIIDSGEYGKVIGCRGFVPWSRGEEYYHAQPWRGQMQYAGGGCMINQSVHTLDLLYYLCGDITAIHSTVNRLSDLYIEVEDTVTARLEFANGAKGVFMATNCNYTNESVQIRIALERGTFQIENDILWEIHPDQSRAKLVENKKMAGEKFYFGASHEKLIHKFYRAVAENTDDYIHVRDAEMSIRLIDTIHESSRQDRKLSVLE